MRRSILLTKLWLLLFLLPVLVHAQVVINGHVYSETDQAPLAGLSVTIKGTKTGVSTSVDGLFTIKAKNGDVLVISGIGVVSQDRDVQSGVLVGVSSVVVGERR